MVGRQRGVLREGVALSAGRGEFYGRVSRCRQAGGACRWSANIVPIDAFIIPHRRWEREGNLTRFAPHHVIPAQAGTQEHVTPQRVIPAQAGTQKQVTPRHVIPAQAGTQMVREARCLTVLGSFEQ